MVIKAGSVMEEERQQGLAHLLEHMAFNGSNGNTVRLGVVSLYNRVLTDLEFEQNFNALKGRYGY